MLVYQRVTIISYWICNDWTISWKFVYSSCTGLLVIDSNVSSDVQPAKGLPRDSHWCTEPPVSLLAKPINHPQWLTIFIGIKCCKLMFCIPRLVVDSWVEWGLAIYVFSFWVSYYHAEPSYGRSCHPYLSESHHPARSGRHLHQGNDFSPTCICAYNAHICVQCTYMCIYVIYVYLSFTSQFSKEKTTATTMDEIWPHATSRSVFKKRMMSRWVIRIQKGYYDIYI